MINITRVITTLVVVLLSIAQLEAAVVSTLCGTPSLNKQQVLVPSPVDSNYTTFSHFEVDTKSYETGDFVAAYISIYSGSNNIKVSQLVYQSPSKGKVILETAPWSSNSSIAGISEVYNKRFVSVHEVEEEEVLAVSTVEFRLYEDGVLQKSTAFNNPLGQESFVESDTNAVVVDIAKDGLYVLIRPEESTQLLIRYDFNLQLNLNVSITPFATGAYDRADRIQVDDVTGTIYVFIQLYYDEVKQFVALHNLKSGTINFPSGSKSESFVYVLLAFSNDGTLQFAKQLLDQIDRKDLLVRDMALAYNQNLAPAYLVFVGERGSDAFFASFDLTKKSYVEFEEMDFHTSTAHSVTVVNDFTQPANNSRVYSPVAIVVGSVKSGSAANPTAYIAAYQITTGDLIDTQVLNIKSSEAFIVHNMSPFDKNGNATIAVAIASGITRSSQSTDIEAYTLKCFIPGRKKWGVWQILVIILFVSVPVVLVIALIAGGIKYLLEKQKYEPLA